MSICANIAEGRGKPTDKDFLKYLYIARGSINECETYLEITRALGYITETQFSDTDKKRGEVGHLLHKLIQSIEQSDS